MSGGIMALMDRHKGKILAASVVMLFMLVVLVPMGASQTATSASVQASPAVSTTPVTMSTGINVSSIFSSIWNLILNFAKGLLNDVQTLIGTMFSGFGGAVSTMFSNWASSLYGLGIWAPVIFVVVLAMAGFMLYFFLDVYGIERDFMHADEDV